ncbi:DUF2384 domain-containing protein [Candidatus Pacearchaeota archaeon]|nr:DUF2384 domain-containing protein [Candidatus Pacearchaeota archaeon]
MSYTNKGIKGLKGFLNRAPERLEISEEDVAKILGCNREEYEKLKNSESWPVEMHDRGYLFFRINLQLGALFGEGFSGTEDYLKAEREFLKTKNPKLENRSPLEIMMETSVTGLKLVADYVTGLCIPDFS